MGPVWVFNFFSSNSMVFTVRPTCPQRHHHHMLAMHMHEPPEMVLVPATKRFPVAHGSWLLHQRTRSAAFMLYKFYCLMRLAAA